MAISYPGISFLRGYDTSGDFARKFQDSFDWGRGLRNEQEAPEAFAAYLDSLMTGTGSESSTVMPGSDRLVYGSHADAINATDPMLETFFANTRRSESGGDDGARNPNSTATGRYQFLEGTWADLARRHPELGLTPDGRTDPAQQERAMRVFTQENASALRKSGVPINPGSLYAAHFLGAGAAPNVLSGDPNSPVSAYVDPGVIQANPFLADMTVADFQQWAAQKGGNGAGGYQPPMGDLPAQGASSGPQLPSREVMLQLFANPITRPLAIELVKSAQAGVAAKPIEINGQLVDPATGRVVGDYRDPETAKAPTVTTRYNPETGLEEKFQWNAQTGTWEPFGGQKAPSNGLTVTTNPDGTTTVQQGGTGKLTEAQGKDVVFYTRGIEADKQLAGLEQNLTDLGGTAAGWVPLGLGNYLKTPEFRQAKVAADQFLAAILRKDTGAAITNTEFDLYGPMFLPIPGDDPATIEQKRRMRKVGLLAIKSGLGTAEAIATANEAILGVTPPAEALNPSQEVDLTGDTPPEGWTGDPELWPFLDVEDRKLWLN